MSNRFSYYLSNQMQKNMRLFVDGHFPIESEKNGNRKIETFVRAH